MTEFCHFLFVFQNNQKLEKWMHEPLDIFIAKFAYLN